MKNINIIISDLTERQKDLILGVLAEAEEEGELDFPFSVKTEKAITPTLKTGTIVKLIDPSAYSGKLVVRRRLIRDPLPSAKPDSHPDAEWKVQNIDTNRFYVYRTRDLKIVGGML